MNQDLKTVSGFLFSGISCGIKENKPDLALIYSLYPARAAAVFTTNLFPAAPVCLSKKAIKSGKPVRSIIVNSGNANACTGKKGLEDAHRMQSATAEKLGIKAGEVLVASTGIIGRPLPIKRIEENLDALTDRLSKEKKPAAEAILTTDTRTKEYSLELDFKGKPARLAGFAKGSGMIRPNMATMLAFLVTDADIPRNQLDNILDTAVERSFNRISVDNDMSTNDSVFLLANGASGVAIRKEEELKMFSDALNKLCLHLAKELIRDAEGGTKVIKIMVEGAKTEAEAGKVARQVAGSLLVKTAAFGQDPNWGRVIAAVGSAGAAIDPDRVSVSIMGTTLVSNGEAVKGTDLKNLSKRMEAGEIPIQIDLNQGSGRFIAYSSDISCEYVKINAEYTT
ncbi:MAG: bifunctional glutamate N-acetyltransferase/amino-acid acetyltransferase ArgJ [bacterium]